MKLLLISLLLFNQGGDCLKKDFSGVHISVVSQKMFVNRGHHPWNNRRVTFRMVNESSQPLIVYGLVLDKNDFDPTGYILILNKSTGAWDYPTGDNRPISWSERSSVDKDRYILLPGRAITFLAEMSQLDVGGHFRRLVYASYNKKDEPCEIRSEEFILR
jgi:hypothetical protein